MGLVRQEGRGGQGIAQKYAVIFLVTVAPPALAVRARTLAARQASRATPPRGLRLGGLGLRGRRRMLDRRFREKQREAEQEKQLEKKPKKQKQQKKPQKKR